MQAATERTSICHVVRPGAEIFCWIACSAASAAASFSEVSGRAGQPEWRKTHDEPNPEMRLSEKTPIAHLPRRSRTSAKSARRRGACTAREAARGVHGMRCARRGRVPARPSHAMACVRAAPHHMHAIQWQSSRIMRVILSSRTPCEVTERLPFKRRRQRNSRRTLACGRRGATPRRCGCTGRQDSGHAARPPHLQASNRHGREKLCSCEAGIGQVTALPSDSSQGGGEVTALSGKTGVEAAARPPTARG